jgi:hypothetical protein
MSTEKTFKNSRVYLPELFAALNATGPNQRQKRIDIIKEFASKGVDHLRMLQAFVECTFHPAVKFDLPEGTPPYKENTAPDYTFCSISLFNFFQNKMVPYFIKGHPMYIGDNVKREMIFIQQLESVFKDEAKILVMMKDKQLYGCKKFVNYGLFAEAFPGWLPEVPKEQSAKG